MSEQIKKILCAFGGLFIAILLLGGILYSDYRTRIRQSDNRLRELESELERAYRDLSEAATTVTAVRNSLRELSDELRTSTEGIDGVIDKLRATREKVYNLEVYLYSSGFDYSDINGSSITPDILEEEE
ncbi:MAG: hypothetical protein MJZ37_00505 [Bacilli bacterium]|nr:hypothetical protein [Bacilli bacterium]